VEIALMRLGLPLPISLFRHIDEFSAVNPLLKAPTLIADDGTVLTDSTLIVDYAATLAPEARSLTPGAPREVEGAAAGLFGDRLTLADITLSTAFAFAQSYLQDIVDRVRYGAVASLSARAEALAEFRAAPAQDGATVSPLAR
jgi:glutathione S-transferase